MKYNATLTCENCKYTINFTEHYDNNEFIFSVYSIYRGKNLWSHYKFRTQSDIDEFIKNNDMQSCNERMINGILL